MRKIPEFPLPDGANRWDDVEEDNEVWIEHPPRKLGDIVASRKTAAQIIRDAKKFGVNLTPSSGGGAVDTDGYRQNIVYVPRDSQEGQAYRENRAKARRAEGYRGLGVWRHNIDKK